MQIESGLSLIDTVTLAMRGQSERMRNNTIGVVNATTYIPDMVGTEDDMGSEAGVGSCGSLIDIDNVPVRMMNLLIAAKTYEANVGVLGRYKQMTETKLELLG